MESRLSNVFYEKIKQLLEEGNIENEEVQNVLETVDWQEVYDQCRSQIICFFERLTIENLEENDISAIGAISFNWNQYGGNITIDFSPSNDVETAYNEGYIMADTAIINDWFFQKYFSIDGEESLNFIDRDYNYIIYAFSLIIEELFPNISDVSAIQRFKRKSPCLVAFSAYDDELPEIFYTF